MRGAFQSCGQNCAGAERFLVHSAVYDRSESPRHPPVSLPITQRADLLEHIPRPLAAVTSDRAIFIDTSQ